MRTRTSAIHISGIMSIISFITVAISISCTNMDSMDMTAYHMELLTTKHFHAFTTTDTLLFQVLNENQEPRAGLSPQIMWQLTGSSLIDSTQPGEVVDRNDGTYHWVNTFLGAGIYKVIFGFHRHDEFHADTFEFTSTFAGGERIFCPDTVNPRYNYQVRWNAKPGYMHAGEDVTFEIDLKRSTNVPVVIDKPWTNTFQRLTTQDLLPIGAMPVVIIGSASGMDTLTVTRASSGMYEAMTKFPSSLTTTTPFWLQVVFSDSCKSIDENGQTNHEYQFSVMPLTMPPSGHNAM